MAEKVEVVIKIPKVFYEALKQTDIMVSGQRSGKTLMSVIYNAVANGVPLPKGHGRLVDADSILEDPFGNTYKDLDIAETIVEADAESEG